MVPEPARLCERLVAAGYGFGAVLTTFPISTRLIKTSGHQHDAARMLGHHPRRRRLAAALGLKRPPVVLQAATPATGGEGDRPRAHPAGDAAHPALLADVRHDDADGEFGGLMVISQFGAFSRDLGPG